MDKTDFSRKALLVGAILMAIAVGIGAFGAHGLKAILIENGRLDTFETGVKYLFYHALAILSLPIFEKHINSKKINQSFLLFLSGILIFSGSLFILSVTNITILGAITPIGGICFILGWLLLAWNVYKTK